MHTTSPMHRVIATVTAASLLWAPPALASDDETQPQKASKADQSITDSQLTSEVASRLHNAKAVPGGALDVAAAEGIVTLTGTVDTLLAKERAAHHAGVIKGVRAVVNRIGVRPHELADSTLRAEVNLALMNDPATDSWEIDVRSQDGMLTLSGEVDSFAERELAAAVAKGVKGVRGLTNDIEVLYTSERTDHEIQADIVQRLAFDARVDDESITVEVADGKVTLSGIVGSAGERSLARTDAWLAGVRSVEDELIVEWWSQDPDRSPRRYAVVPDDEQIREAVVDALLYDPRVYSFNPTVAVTDGVVTLTGTVDNIKARRAAAQDARNTTGVEKVHNRLLVSPRGTPLDDQFVEVDARRALARDVFVSDEDIEVDVSDGRATLSGDVSSYFAREQAEDVIGRVRGVAVIENDLSVAYPMTSESYAYHDWNPLIYGFQFDYAPATVAASDEEIREEIADELWWSPFVDRDDIQVSVSDGIATLDGNVDSWYEFDSATENAYEGGARLVINKLSVDHGQAADDES